MTDKQLTTAEKLARAILWIDGYRRNMTWAGPLADHDTKILDDIEAALRELEKMEENEMAWLVERVWHLYQGADKYWDGRRFISDPNKALRLARKDDGYRVLFNLPNGEHLRCIVVEHMWVKP